MLLIDDTSKPGGDFIRKRFVKLFDYLGIFDDSLTAEMKGKNKSQEKGLNSKNKRVLIRVIDFDFLFQNDNSVTLIQILAGLESNKILTRSSIKAFVGLMW